LSYFRGSQSQAFSQKFEILSITLDGVNLKCQWFIHLTCAIVSIYSQYP
jgi:hypothetical protein